MKAYEIQQFGIENLSLVERDEPTPQTNEVKVKFHAASLNYRDLWVVKGFYNLKLKMPLVSFSDGAGEVTEIGKAVTKFKVGNNECRRKENYGRQIMVINKINSKSAAVFFLLFLLILHTLDAKGQTKSNSISTENVVDLTHTLTEDFPFFQIPGIYFPFKKIPIATIEKIGVASFRWEIHEHIGTQIDAPSHFFADGLSLEQMPVRQFIAPLAVIDISSRARTNADTSVMIEDIKIWEKKYGRLPKGAAVFMYSGWDAKVNDAKAFINMDGSGAMHFPGFSPEAALFLARERDVVGIGVDTLSLDPGKDKEYKAHKAWLAAGKWGVECAANLKQVPPVGATVFVGAPKVGGATGGLVRLIATFPSSAMKTSSFPVIRKRF